MKFLKKNDGKGKAFAPFARLQRPLLAAAMLIAALFFASCGNAKDVNELLDNLNIPSTLQTLSIKGESPYILQGDSMDFTVTFAGVPVLSKLANLQVKGKQDADTRIKDGKLLVGKNEPAGELTITGGYEASVGNAAVAVAGKAVVTVVADLANNSIKSKFGVKAAGEAGVTETFTALHKFIQAGGLTNGKTNDVIKTGGWIDLEGGLSIAGAAVGADALRLIVVGINSFQSSGVTDGYTYQGGETPPAHLVFQFENIPVKHGMLNSDQAHGYETSAMREYLTRVQGVDGSGSFLNGLLAAGVPEPVIWAPARAVSKYAVQEDQITILRDALWLPTGREIFLNGQDEEGISTVETGINQARLEYYANDSSRIKKYNGSPAVYWEASNYNPVNGGARDASFCAVTSQGHTGAEDPFSAQGAAPAFCVQ
jgi:hypothetical protein